MKIIVSLLLGGRTYKNVPSSVPEGAIWKFWWPERDHTKPHWHYKHLLLRIRSGQDVWVPSNPGSYQNLLKPPTPTTPSCSVTHLHNHHCSACEQGHIQTVSVHLDSTLLTLIWSWWWLHYTVVPPVSYGRWVNTTSLDGGWGGMIHKHSSCLSNPLRMRTAWVFQRTGDWQQKALDVMRMKTIGGSEQGRMNRTQGLEKGRKYGFRCEDPAWRPLRDRIICLKKKKKLMSESYSLKATV